MVLILATYRASICAAPPETARLGDCVGGFSAKDVWGRSHSLSDVGPDKIVVLAFVGIECPIAKLYTPRLIELARKYEPRGITFFGIDSNTQDSITQIATYLRRSRIPFPILKDLRQKIANHVGATRTPQMVVLDRARRIRYRGRIDDQFGFVRTEPKGSYRRAAPGRQDLAAALDAILAGEPVTLQETAVAGCLIGRDREPVSKSDVTFSKDVAPILNNHCVLCHRNGQIAPFSLTNFEETAGWADMIAEVTQTSRMPPWHADERYGHFANDPRLNDAEKHILAKWAQLGAPEGDPTDLPPPPHFADGWLMPQPDEILYMSAKPFEVPATGVVELTTLVVDPGWKDDRWITAIEPRPGNRSVVHHILVYAIPRGGSLGFNQDNIFLGVYAPGLSQEPLPKGFARFVKAGSQLVFNVHYTPNGSPQQDRSYVGIKFALPESPQREVIASASLKRTFVIPPGASNYEVRSSYAFRRDSLILTLLPHLHLRGKDFLYEAVYPDGTREVLLSVPRYDFGWQTIYRLSEPKSIPKGTVLSCVAHYDNSEDNPNNPDPKAAVTWGEQIFDEMMIGFFEATPTEESLIGWCRSRITMNNSFFGAQLLAGAFTTVSLAIGIALVFRRKRPTVFKNSRICAQPAKGIK